MTDVTNIFIVNIEPLETRYTAQWAQHLPKILADGIEGPTVIHSVEGTISSAAPTEGAFLDFAATNIYKGDQVKRLAERFQMGAIQDGDHIIFLDAWHPGIINVKYMKDLLGVDVTLHGLWHAGSYDPQDFLGRLIKDKRWSKSVETAYFHALDHNWFATQFHIDLFQHNVFGRDDILWQLSDDEIANKFGRTGWPMEYMPALLEPFKAEKEDIILFPHRLAPEKQPEIFRDLAKEMPEYQFIVCQDQELTKDEYHTLLGKAKIVFSANLQETLGISAYEGMLVDALPLVPNRLSYTEMYNSNFMYPAEWTKSFEDYEYNKASLKAIIKKMMDNHTECLCTLEDLRVKVHNEFFSCTKMIEAINNANIR